MAQGLTAEQQQVITDYIETARMAMSEAIVETLADCERALRSYRPGD